MIEKDRESHFITHSHKLSRRPIFQSFLSDRGGSSNFFKSCNCYFIADLIIEPFTVDGQVELIRSNIIKQLKEDKEKSASLAKVTDKEMAVIQKNCQENHEVNTVSG